MSEDVQVVPIQPAEIDRSMTALVQAKRDILPELIGKSVEELEGVYRRFYHAAVVDGWRTIINLVVMQSDARMDNLPYWHFSTVGIEIKAAYDPMSGITVVESNGQKVFSNEKPLEVMCNPGRWMAYVRDAYFKALLSQEWQADLQTEKKRTDLIHNFGKDV